MRRWFLHVVAAIVVGCMITVGVSWQAAFWPSQVQVYWAAGRNAPHDWITTPPDRNPSIIYVDISTSSFISANRTVFTQSSFSTPRPTNYTINSPPNSDWNYLVHHESFGWPMRAMYHELAFANADGAGLLIPLELGSQREGLSTGRQFAGATRMGRVALPYDEIRLPLRVHPIGFVTNSLFAGLICIFPFVLLWLNKKWITMNRLQHGRCSACGYDLTDLKTCPECGTDATKKAGA
jgi:hypothetical protein